MRGRAVSTAIALAILLAGCSEGDADRAAPPAPTTATTVQDVAAGRAIADAAVLRQPDLPAGWTGTPHAVAGDDTSGQQQLSECLGVDVAQFADDPTTVHSPDFEVSQPRLEARNAVRVDPGIEDARARLAVFERPEMAGCLSTLVSGQVAAGLQTLGAGSVPASAVSLGQVTTERLAFPALGDGVVGYRVSVPIETGGQQATLSADFVVVTKGAASTTFQFLGMGTPFPPELAVRLAEAVVGRLPPS